MKFYEHSGRGGTWGVPLAAVTRDLGRRCVLAVVYVYVLNWIPFIYVSFLATAGVWVWRRRGRWLGAPRSASCGT